MGSKDTNSLNFLKMWAMVPIVFVTLLACGLLTGTPDEVEPVAVQVDVTSVPVATGVGEVAAPSPLELVYIGGGNVMRWTETGGEVALTQAGSVVDLRLSADRQVVAYLRSSDYRNYELRAVGIDGSNDRTLVSSEALNSLKRATDAYGIGVREFEWIPGTHRLAYSTYHFFQGPGSDPNDELIVVNADTGAQTVILPPDTGGQFSYAPDGSQIALTTEHAISFTAADGSARANDVLSYGPIPLTESLYVPRPVWAPDSSALIVAIPPADFFADTPGPTAIWRVPAGGGTVQQIATLDATPIMGFGFSPDLSKVAYLRRTGQPIENRFELHIATVDGTSDVAYDTDVSLQFIAWSPDSRRFVYRGEGGGARVGELAEQPVPLDGALAHDATVLSVQWLGVDRIVYLVASAPDWEVRRVVVGQSGQLVHAFTSETVPVLVAFGSW